MRLSPALRLRVAIGIALLVVLAVAWFALVPNATRPLDRLVIWAWQLNYRIWALDDPDRLRDLHAEARNASRAQCIACHGDKTDSKLPLHRIHLRSELIDGLTCQDCHRRVELAHRDNKTMVTWVDVGFCKQCHSAFPGEHAGSRMKPADYEADCLKCHKGESAPKHDAPYLAETIAPSECKGCHGGRALPWTPEHETAGWLQTHGDEALARGTEDCFQCHDFGLKFCDDCHGTKPPSHTPQDAWLDRHVEEARSDTRVCYTCHRTSFCKGCHLNHEDGWLENHPAFVREKGDDSCGECHSASACTYCHTAATQP